MFAKLGLSLDYGYNPTKIKKRRMRSGKKIKPKDIAIFTRQLIADLTADVEAVPCKGSRRGGCEVS